MRSDLLVPNTRHAGIAVYRVNIDEVDNFVSITVPNTTRVERRG